MELTRLIFNDFMLAAAETRRVLAKYLPARTPQGPHDVGLICFTDGQQAFFLFNQMLVMSKRNPTSGEYSEDVFETVVVAGPQRMYETLPLEESISFELDWSGGPTIWRPGAFEQLIDKAEPLQLTLKEAVVSSTVLEGGVVEFLLDLRMQAMDGEWAMRRSMASPDFMSIFRIPAERFGAA